MKYLLALLMLVTSVFGQSSFSSGFKTPYVEQTSQARLRSLPAMQLRRLVATLPSVSAGISDVTYNPRSGTLFMIRNVSGASAHIYEMSLDGILLRTITESATAGEWIDTEAIAWVGWDNTTGSDVFAVGEEENPTAAAEGRISLVKITPAATTVTRTTAGNVSALTAYTNGTINNLGLEAMCYDPVKQRLYYTSEKRTQAGSDSTAYASGPGQWRIFQRSATISSTGVLALGTESVLCDILPLLAGAPMTDISAMTFDGISQTIILHSDESDKVVRISKTGTLIEQLAIPMNQGEGVAIHPDGTELYVTGENQEYQRWGVGIHRGQPYKDFRSGTATLAAGVVTVTDSAVTANTRIFVQRQTDGGTIGDTYSITRTAGTSFTITAKLNSANHVTDTSVMAWVAFEP